MKKKLFISLIKVFLLMFIGLFFSIAAYAQDISVKGHIKDANTGEPVIGATVLVKGTAQGTISDANGNFILKIPSNSTLSISFLGYATQEIAASTSEILIALTEDAVMLGEVVAIGYGTVKKKDVTGSVASFKVDEENEGKVTSVQDLLVGKIAGVNVVNSGGQPGGSSAIRIRGGSSISAKNDPLIVIDGVPTDNSGVAGVSNPLGSINPNDIETFSVLKDASATAIYGSRASNGVIIITTKKGEAGSAPRISYDGNASLSTKQDQIDVMTGDEYREFITNTGDPLAIAKLGTASTDWQDEIFDEAWGTDQNITLTGGLKNMPYRASVGYSNQDGILETSNFERVSGSFGLSPSLFDKHLNINLNAKGSNVKNQFADAGAINAALSMDPTKPVRDGNSTYGGFYTWESSPGVIDGNATRNPVSLLELKDDRSTANSFIGNAQFDYKLHFLPELRFNLNLGMDMTDSEGTLFIPENAPSEYTNGGKKGNYSQVSSNKLLEFYSQYTKEVESLKSNFDIMGGYSWQHFYTSGSNFYQDVDETKKFEDSDFKREYFLVSFYGRFNYKLMEKYLMTVTVRNDGTSRYSPENRWGLFPSLALGWKINEEAFMKDFESLSDLKLRLGWGLTGQQDLNDEYYPYVPRYSYAEDNASSVLGYDENGKPILVKPLRGDAFNKELKWETTETFNIGLDYGFLNNRINGAIDYYFRETRDMINRVPIPAGSNLTDMLLRNVGNMENSGIEFSINAKPIVTKDFTWDVGYNISYNKNEVTRLIDGDDPNYKGVFTGSIEGGTNEKILINSVGHPVNSFYVYQQVYDDAGMPVEGLYVDRNSDGKIDENDRYVHENGTPDVMMGFSSKFTYRKWDLGFNVRANLGNYMYNSVAASNAALSMSDVFYTQSYLSNRVTSAFDTDFQNRQLLSDYYIQDASFIRVDNISMGYSFDKLFSSKLNGRVYGTVQNPFIFTKYTGLDPEVTVALDNGAKSGAGIDNRMYPRPIVFLMGVNLNF